MSLIKPMRGLLPGFESNWIGREVVPGTVGYPRGIIAQYNFNENNPDDNDDLITDGDMSNAASWSKGTGWSIAGGVASCDGSQTGISYLYQNASISEGKRYKAIFTLANYGSGDVRINVGNEGYGIRRSANGTYSQIIEMVGTRKVYLQANNTFVGDIDNVSVKLCTVEDSSGNGHNMLMQRDTNAISVPGKINRAFDFNGTSDYGAVGDTSSDVKAISMWCNPDAVDVTDYLIDLNGTDYITIVNGTVIKNGFGLGTQVIYVDGVIASIVTANWHFIILTSTDGFTADDLDIGRLEGIGYFGGLLDNVILWDRMPSAYEISRQFQNQYSAYRKRRHGGR